MADASQELTATLEVLPKLKTLELLGLYRAILAELRSREVIRSNNAPGGDYAELLVKLATGGELGAASTKSWDVRTPEGERLQVKSRTVTDPRNAGERQLSPFRSWDFDASLVVLFDDQFRVWKAARLPRELVEEVARSIGHDRSFRVMATDALLARGEDWAERLRAAAAL
jgi:hypothetical protein